MENYKLKYPLKVNIKYDIYNADFQVLNKLKEIFFPLTYLFAKKHKMYFLRWKLKKKIRNLS